MRIGVPKEIKVHEYRVGLVPAGVRELVGAGHEVLIETGAGNGIGVDDAQYTAAGAAIARTASSTGPSKTWSPSAMPVAMRAAEW